MWPFPLNARAKAKAAAATAMGQGKGRHTAAAAAVTVRVGDPLAIDSECSDTDIEDDDLAIVVDSSSECPATQVDSCQTQPIYTYQNAQVDSMQ